jgi:hypothetical protein
VIDSTGSHFSGRTALMLEWMRLKEIIRIDTFRMMEVMVKDFNLTESELVQGTGLLWRGLCGLFKSGGFDFSLEKARAIFAAGILIAHKQSGDSHHKNIHWSQQLIIPLPDLNDMEVRFLKACDFRTVISGQECLAIVSCLEKIVDAALTFFTSRALISHDSSQP